MLPRGYVALSSGPSRLACAVMSNQLATMKGADALQWTLWGLLFGPLGLLGAVGLPDRGISRGSAKTSENTEPDEKPKSSNTAGRDAKENWGGGY